MLDHISLQCADFEASATFYNAVLPTIGSHALVEFDEVLGYGESSPMFWIGAQRTGSGFRESHVAFTAPSRAAVRAFYEAAVASGAAVLYEPKVWPEYHPDYFAAFVRDPDGNNIEAVCRQPE
jgi:catechol 2,3-dioxygenase-like lactoylglutathione lyase family enzyme